MIDRTLPPPVVRLARLDDANDIARIGHRSFREAFAAGTHPDDLADYLREAFDPVAIAVELQQRSNTFYLALSPDDGSPVGFAKMVDGPADPSVRGETPIQLSRLYILPDHHRLGLGGALLQVCLAHARARGHATLWLGVWENNQPALAFYARNHLELVGSKTFVVGRDEQCDLVMERPVD